MIFRRKNYQREPRCFYDVGRIVLEDDDCSDCSFPFWKFPTEFLVSADIISSPWFFYKGGIWRLGKETHLGYDEKLGFYVIFRLYRKKSFYIRSLRYSAKIGLKTTCSEEFLACTGYVDPENGCELLFRIKYPCSYLCSFPSPTASEKGLMRLFFKIVLEEDYFNNNAETNRRKLRFDGMEPSVEPSMSNLEENLDICFEEEYSFNKMDKGIRDYRRKIHKTLKGYCNKVNVLRDLFNVLRYFDGDYSYEYSDCFTDDHDARVGDYWRPRYASILTSRFADEPTFGASSSLDYDLSCNSLPFDWHTPPTVVSERSSTSYSSEEPRLLFDIGQKLPRRFSRVQLIQTHARYLIWKLTEDFPPYSPLLVIARTLQKSQYAPGSNSKFRSVQRMLISEALRHLSAFNTFSKSYTVPHASKALTSTTPETDCIFPPVSKTLNLLCNPFVSRDFISSSSTSTCVSKINSLSGAETQTTSSVDFPLSATGHTTLNGLFQIHPITRTVTSDETMSTSQSTTADVTSSSTSSGLNMRPTGRYNGTANVSKIFKEPILNNPYVSWWYLSSTMWRPLPFNTAVQSQNGSEFQNGPEFYLLRVEKLLKSQGVQEACRLCNNK